MKEKKPEYQIRQDFLHSFKTSIKNYAEYAFMLKNSANRGEVSSSLLNLFKVLPAYEKLTFGNLFPTTVEQLGLGTSVFFKPENLENELYWLLIPIRHHKKQMKEFIELRDIVETSVMLGNYDEALDLLDSSIKNLGHSVWLYEMKTLIYCQLGKKEEVYSMITEINKKKKDAKYGFVTFLLSSLLSRSMTDVSAYQYDYDLISLYKRNKNEFHTHRFLYFLYRLNFYSNYNRGNEATTLLMENTNSLIDRYILILNILKSYSSQENADTTMVARYAKRLHGLLNDPCLYPFIAADNIANVPIDYYDKAFIDILDAYYTGDYEAVILQSSEYIKRNPCCFDVIRFYNRALIFLGRSYKPITPNRASILNRLSEKVFFVLKGVNNSQYLYELYQLLKNLSGLSIAPGLDLFIREENNESRIEKIYYLSLVRFDPIVTNLFQTDSSKNRYLSYGLKNIANSIVIDYQKRRVGKQTTEDDRVVAYIRNSDNAKIAFETCNYEKALEMWLYVYATSAKSMPTLQVAISYIFQCYLHLHQYSEAVAFYVDRYLENRNIVNKVETDDFAKVLKKQRYKGYKYSIDFLIFVFLTAKNGTEKNFVLTNFCKYKEVSLPSELIGHLSDEKIEKVEMFFHMIFQEDMLRHHKLVKSTLDILQEKQRIIHYLLTLGSLNQRQYLQEESELMEEMIVYTGIKKMDEGKIYANDQAIIKYELTDIDDLYKRFATQYDLMQTGLAIYLVDTSTNVTDIESSPNVSIYSAQFKYTDSAVLEVANEIYSKISHAYLKSKFGIDTYLSTRIRHGVFEGELRPVLSELHLILNTEKKRYITTDYWLRKYALSSDTNAALMDELKVLSHGVDFAISEFKSKILQIKTVEDEIGYFDYVLSPEDVQAVEITSYRKSQDAEGFIKETFAFLRSKTEQNLDNIRSVVRTELSDRFSSLFERFDKYISKLPNNHFSEDLETTLQNARTQIAYKLERIEKWFYMQDSQFDDMTLRNIMNIVWENTETSFPDVPAKCSTAIPANIMIKADYGIHFIDLLRIFFSNMLKYSKKTLPYRELAFQASVDSKVLKLHFENETDRDDDELSQEIQDKMSSRDRLSGEVGTGLVKAEKIVKYDLKNINNQVLVTVKDHRFHVDVSIDLNSIE